MRGICAILYINHSGKYIEINFIMKIPFLFSSPSKRSMQKFSPIFYFALFLLYFKELVYVAFTSV